MTSGRTGADRAASHVPGTNWAGNLRYGAATVHEPYTTGQLQRIVGSATSIRALGSRHSFSSVADGTAELVSTAALTGPVRVNRDAMTVTAGAGIRYGELAGLLHREGYALANLASLPHITVGGAVATGTHGSGDRNRSLAAAVVGLELVTAGGGLLRMKAGQPDFDGAVVSLGALGVVTELTLAIEPGFTVEQHVYENLPWDALMEHFESITAAAYSVSIFTTWRSRDRVDQVWLKRRPDQDGPAANTLFGARAATTPRHPLPGVSAVNCTQQLGVPGPWLDRLPHFRMAFTPSSGAEIQSEYLVPREHGRAALAGLRELGGAIAPLLQACEIRTVAADGLWLSPAYGTDVVGIHFTWEPDQAAVEALLPRLEAALAPYSARPHWGKVFTTDAPVVAGLYPRMPDFARLVRRLDPGGVFGNPFVDRYLAATPAGGRAAKAGLPLESV
jgi:xylitol oxidase